MIKIMKTKCDKPGWVQLMTLSNLSLPKSMLIITNATVILIINYQFCIKLSKDNVEQLYLYFKLESTLHLFQTSIKY